MLPKGSDSVLFSCFETGQNRRLSDRFGLLLGLHTESRGGESFLKCQHDYVKSSLCKHTNIFYGQSLFTQQPKRLKGTGYAQSAYIETGQNR